ncbi:hypothetical protein [Pseudomonas sp.]|uniref:hypothetical protein n=1 Tax=Pseudomonas sp. TaxID=306 RepID=UPI003D6E1074
MQILIALLMFLSSYAYAGCGSIRDADQRNYCYAREGGSSCGSISNSDQRNYCYAKQGKGSCGSIKDSDLRNQCNALKP